MKGLWNYKALTFDHEAWQKKLFSQHKWLLDTIIKLNPQSILEVGCGFGRNLNFLIDNGIDPHKLSGVDFSLVMLLKAQMSLHTNVQLIKASALKLPFADNAYELVFTHGLLMHIKPNQITKALQELVRVSHKHLLLVEEIRPTPQQLNNFTWAHDYEKIIKLLPVKITFTYQDPKLKLKWLHLTKLNTATKENSTR